MGESNKLLKLVFGYSYSCTTTKDLNGNVDETYALYQRDDDRTPWVPGIGNIYMQGWLVSPGTNALWHSSNPALLLIPVPDPLPTMEKTYRDGNNVWHTIDVFPHTEMIFDQDVIAELSEDIDNQ